MGKDLEADIVENTLNLKRWIIQTLRNSYVDVDELQQKSGFAYSSHEGLTAIRKELRNSLNDSKFRHEDFIELAKELVIKIPDQDKDYRVNVINYIKELDVYTQIYLNIKNLNATSYAALSFIFEFEFEADFIHFRFINTRLKVINFNENPTENSIEEILDDLRSVIHDLRVYGNPTKEEARRAPHKRDYVYENLAQSFDEKLEDIEVLYMLNS